MANSSRRDSGSRSGSSEGRVGTTLVLFDPRHEDLDSVASTLRERSLAIKARLAAEAQGDAKS